MGERRTARTVAALVCAATVLSAGCTPQPQPRPFPTPVATGFASDEEAFAAAEATYRAYIDAVNARRDGEAPAADPESFLRDPARQSSLNAQARFEAEGIHLTGRTVVTDVLGVRASGDSTTIQVCIDSSEVKVIGEDGVDLTPPDRIDDGALEIDMRLQHGRMFIVNSREAANPC